MFEIKITGSTADEIRNDLKELGVVFGATEAKAAVVETDCRAEKEVVVNEQPKPAKNTKPDKPAKEETTGTDGQAESTTKDEADTAAKETPANEEPKYTLEEVRAKAASLNREGKKDLVKNVITKTGATKLTEVDSSYYSWMMECFEAGSLVEGVK